MNEIPLFVYISMALFFIGLLGILIRRNTLILFLSIEMMLNAANLLFIDFAHRWGNQTGHAWVFFVLVVAAMEAAVGLAIIINLFRFKQIVDVDQYNDLKG